MKPFLHFGLYSALTLTLVFSGDFARGNIEPAPDSVRGTALQACPVVEEEIVDLELLGSGLRKSKAIGMFEKLRLKSAIDDLLDRMQAFHDGDGSFTQNELQEQYDVLLMRIAANLQNKDTALHGQLCNAWVQIWLDLEDPDRFAEKFS